MIRERVIAGKTWATACLLALSFTPLWAPIHQSDGIAWPAAYASEDDKLLYLGNEFIEIQFKKSNGGIHAVINKATGHDYRDNKTAAAFPGQLYAVRLVGQQEKVLWQNNLAGFSYNLKSHPDESMVELTGQYTQLRSGYEATVKVTVRLNSHSSLTFWRILVENRGSLAVDLIIFPIINGFQKIGPTYDDDYIIAADFFGSKLNNPYKAIMSNPSSRCFGAENYPSLLSRAQLLIAGDSDGGLYLATYDNEGNVKDFLVCRGSTPSLGQPLYIAVQHWIPESPGSSIQLTYDTIVGVFPGDWHRAADMYKEWAYEQWWVKEGSLASRADLPIWFRRGFSMLTVNSYGQFRKFYTFRETVDKVLEYARELNMPILLRWVGWERYGNWVAPDVFPPYEGEEAFRSVIKELHDRGHRVLVPLSGGPLYANRTEFVLGPKLLECARRAKDGNIVMFVAGSVKTPHASPACKAFQEWLVQTVVKLAQLGVDGVQLDAMLLYPFDYNTAHGNPKGHGSWWAREIIGLTDMLHREAKAVNPDFILANEGMSELFIPFHELYMTDANNLHVRAENLGYALSIEPIPIFEYLYHGFILPFSRGFPAEDHKFDSYNHWAIALGATWGIIPNPGSHTNFTLTKGPSTPLTIMFTGYARDFTAFGFMSLPPELNAPATSLTIPLRRSSADPWRVYTYLTPAIMVGGWESPDSRLAYTFINVSNKTVKFTVRINLSKVYAADRGRPIILRMDEQMISLLDAPQSGTLKVNLTLEASKSMVLQILSRQQFNTVLLDHDAVKTRREVQSLVNEVQRLRTQINGLTKVRDEALAASDKIQKQYSDLKNELQQQLAQVQNQLSIWQLLSVVAFVLGSGLAYILSKHKR